MKKNSLTSLFAIGLAFTLIPSPSYAAELTVADFPTRDTLLISATSTKESCGDLSGDLYTYEAPTNSGNEALGPVASLILTPLITAGVDFIGNQLSERAMRRERTISASTNVKPALKTVGPRCLHFKHKDGNIELFISLEGFEPIQNHKNPQVMKAAIKKIKYSKSLSGKNKKERGIIVQLATQRVGTSNSVSQTLLVGNLKTGYKYTKPELVFPLMTNPYHTVEKDKEVSLYPFTITVTVTEIRDANKALGFASSVANAGNDDLTAALIDIAN